MIKKFITSNIVKLISIIMVIVLTLSIVSVAFAASAPKDTDSNSETITLGEESSEDLEMASKIEAADPSANINESDPNGERSINIGPGMVEDFVVGFFREDGSVDLEWKAALQEDNSEIKEYKIYYEYSNPYFTEDKLLATIPHEEQKETYSFTANRNQLISSGEVSVAWGGHYVYFYIVACDNDGNISDKQYSVLLDTFRPGMPPEFKVDTSKLRSTGEISFEWEQARDYPVPVYEHPIVKASGIKDYTLYYGYREHLNSAHTDEHDELYADKIATIPYDETKDTYTYKINREELVDKDGKMLNHEGVSFIIRSRDNTGYYSEPKLHSTSYIPDIIPPEQPKLTINSSEWTKENPIISWSSQDGGLIYDPTDNLDYLEYIVRNKEGEAVVEWRKFTSSMHQEPGSYFKNSAEINMSQFDYGEFTIGLRAVDKEGNISEESNEVIYRRYAILPEITILNYKTSGNYIEANVETINLQAKINSEYYDKSKIWYRKNESYSWRELPLKNEAVNDNGNYTFDIDISRLERDVSYQLELRSYDSFGNMGKAQVFTIRRMPAILVDTIYLDQECVIDLSIENTYDLAENLSVYPSNATKPNIQWESQNQDIASVSQDGVVTALKEGHTQITARAGDGSGKSETCLVTVVGKPKLIEEIVIDKPIVDVTVHYIVDPNIRILPADATNTVLKWSSENPSIAEVTKRGFVNGISYGKTTIRGEATDGSGKFITYEVNVTYANDIENFVERLYAIGLNRPADEIGKSSMVRSLEAKARTGSDIAYSIIFSNEFKNKNYSDSQFVELLYKVLCNRNVDPVGKESWMRALDNGMSRKYVFSGIVNSGEFTSLCKQYGIERGNYKSDEPRDANTKVTTFINRLYQKCLGRAGEVSGINNWASAINKGNKSAGGVAYGFFFSNEFKSKNYSDSEFLDRLYNTMMGRNPDVGGKNSWLNKLKNGTTRETVFWGFVNSKEFTDICKTYGMVR